MENFDKLRTILKFGSLTYSQKQKEYIFSPNQEAYPFLNTRKGYDVANIDFCSLIEDLYNEIVKPNCELI